jgi:hypothetical protein
MPDVPTIKALLMQAAYSGAAAVCEPLLNEPGAPTPIPIDPLIQDAGLQAKGVLVYEEAKVQYAAILRAFADKTGVWPDPLLPGGAGPASGGQVAPAAISAALQALLSQLPPGSTLNTVGSFLQALSSAASPPASTTPAPAAPARPAPPTPSL